MYFSWKIFLGKLQDLLLQQRGNLDNIIVDAGYSYLWSALELTYLMIAPVCNNFPAVDVIHNYVDWLLNIHF